MCPLMPPPLSIVNRIGLPLANEVNRRVRLVLDFSGARPTSYWRSVRENARVGGALRSQHLLGLAVDSVPGRTWTPTELGNLFNRVGLIGVVEADHVHTQAFPAGSIPRSFFDRLP